MSTRWHVAADEADWLARALAYALAAEAEALADHGEFRLCLAGGSTPERLYRELAGLSRDWRHWQVWYGDERCLPAGHPERNSSLAERAWLNRVGIPGANVHAIPAELGAQSGAEVYARRMDGVGAFDLVLLGLGEDGHTASLFPGRDWGEGGDAPAALAVFEAPKPPPERVSLSAHRLARADRVLFLVTGVGKRAAVRAWRDGEVLPAAAIRPAAGVDVLIDQSAYGEQ